MAGQSAARVLWCLRGAVVALPVVGFVVLTLCSGGASAQQPAGVSLLPSPAVVADKLLGEEIVDLRTRTSKTFPGADGRFVTRLFSKAVHFKDTAGQWRDIDNGLVF